MNTDSPYFRAALTIAVIWTAVLAYLSYSDYRRTYRPVAYAQYDVPEDLTRECFSSVLDGSGNDVNFRAQTSEETDSCLGRVRDVHGRSVASSNQFAFMQAWRYFLLVGLLPPLALLGIVAFWTIILRGLTLAGSGYFNWLRFGSRKSLDKNRNDEV